MMNSENNNTPELSKIVGVIMEHPELIEQISGLLSSDSGGAADESIDRPEEKTEPRDAVQTASAPVSAAKQRSRLLYAMKPYLSEKRAKAIDSMLTFGEIFDMMKVKG